MATPPTTLSVPSTVLDQLVEATRSGYPHEVCGLLVGRGSSAGRVEVVRAELAGNLAGPRSRDRFELDPADHLACELRARRDGLEVVGIWHSHPDHDARPSQADGERAWDGWSYLIVATRGREVLGLRAWRPRAGSFVEQRLVETPLRCDPTSGLRTRTAATGR